MARVCPNCGAEAAAEDRFCSSCGNPLASGDGAERKLATMVFVDLVGSTEMAAGSDPEELRRRLEPFFEVARSSLREHGGTIEKYIGDAVLAVFGVPQAHGDDPDRAVAAALDLAGRVGALEEELSVRIGVESGEVLARDGGGDLSVTGEPVNAAARLQQAAAPGEVLIGERAARYCRRVRLEPRDAVDAKGMPAALRSWRALEMTAADADEPSAPLIGREDDLDLLRLAYRRSVRESVPELVIVTGEAGIGKTRLASELLAELRDSTEPPRVLLGRNPPYGRGIAFWALGEIVRDAAGGQDASASEVEASLATLLTELGAEDGATVAATLSVVLGAGEGPGVGEEELRHAWRRFVALLAEDRPLVIGIDDVHWADDGLLDLIEEAALRVQSAPLLLLCTSRPGLTERRPDFGSASPNVTQIELRPLQPEAARRLVELLVPADSRQLAARAAEASGGNPFFAEEVARRILEEPEAAHAERLPDTVQAAVAARIDLLPTDEKCALQYASVLGHTFSAEGLADLLGESGGGVLRNLERRALTQEQLAARPGRYSFRHQLIRDVAYASLPRSERAQLHERAAEGIRARAGERESELAELIAFHLTRAAELDATPARDTAARAATEAAAEIAVRRGAVARGQELYEQIAARVDADGDRFEPLFAASEIALRRWRGDEALSLMREAAAAAERAGDDSNAAMGYAAALEIASRMAGITGKVSEQEMLAMLERGRALAAADDRETQTLLVLDEAWIAWISDREAEMQAPARQALEMARETKNATLISSALDAMAASSWHQGRQRDAVALTRERVELLRDARDTHWMEVERSDARHMMTESLMDIGDFEAAYENGTEAREIDVSRGLSHMGYTRTLLPSFYLGRWDEVLEMAARFREGWVAAGRPPVAAVAAAVASVGAIHGYRGDEGAAAEWFTFAGGISPHHGAQRPGFAIWGADIELHHGRCASAVQRIAAEETGFWWRGPFEATRAEATVRAGRPEAEEMIAAAEETVGEHLYAEAVLRRAKGLHAGDAGQLREALDLFERMNCPFQVARTRWLLGPEEREVAAETFERLGAVLPG